MQKKLSATVKAFKVGETLIIYFSMPIFLILLFFSALFLDETGRGGSEALVQFPILPIGIEPVLEKLRDAGVIRGVYTIMLSPETVISEHIELLKSRCSGERISREELTARAQHLAPAASIYFAFFIHSTIIATRASA